MKTCGTCKWFQGSDEPCGLPGANSCGPELQEETEPCPEWEEMGAGATDAYPDGDPYADTITACRDCAGGVRDNTSGRPSREATAWRSLVRDGESIAEPYDSDGWTCPLCGSEREADVYEVIADLSSAS